MARTSPGGRPHSHLGLGKGHALSHSAETACPSPYTLRPSPKAPALDTLSLKRKNQTLQVPAQKREIRPPNNSNATGS